MQLTFIHTHHRYTTDLAVLQYKLKMQYAAVMFGVSFGFLLGGFVYKAYYIDGVAIFGIIVLSIEARMLTPNAAPSPSSLHNPIAQPTHELSVSTNPSLARLHIYRSDSLAPVHGRCLAR